jgi:hypothetical protein
MGCCDVAQAGGRGAVLDDDIVDMIIVCRETVTCRDIADPFHVARAQSGRRDVEKVPIVRSTEPNSILSLRFRASDVVINRDWITLRDIQWEPEINAQLRCPELNSNNGL